MKPIEIIAGEGSLVNKGYAFGYTGLQIPPGYYSGENMFMEIDGSFTPRPSYVKNHANAIPSGGTTYPVALHVWNIDYMIVLMSNGAWYCKHQGSADWTPCVWTGGGSAPTCSGGGKFQEYNAYLIYSEAQGNVTLRFDTNMPHNFQYLDSVNVNFGGGVCEHANKLLVANNGSNQIRYSDDGVVTGFADNYVNVGTGFDNIVALHQCKENLYVIKRNSIWVKSGMFGELDSDQFHQSNNDTLNIITGTGNGWAFIASNDGIKVLSSGDEIDIATPFHRDMWLKSISGCRFGYWKTLSKLIFSENFGSTFLYDMVEKKWWRWTGLNVTCMANHSILKNFYFGAYSAAGNQYIYDLSSLTLAGGSAMEPTFTQTLQTGWLDFGMPDVNKYIRGVILQGQHVASIQFYSKNTYDHTTDSGQALEYTINSPGVDSRLTPNKPFRQMSIKFNGISGRMAIKSCKLLLEARRKTW